MLSMKRVILCSVLSIAAVAATAAELSTIKSTSNGVTIAVTPQFMSNGPLEFKIVLDTHSQDLNDDLLKSAVLIDNANNRYTPIDWQGAGPGGHHREGILRFAPLREPTAIELQITRAKEQSPRSFRWKLQ